MVNRSILPFQMVSLDMHWAITLIEKDSPDDAQASIRTWPLLLSGGATSLGQLLASSLMASEASCPVDVITLPAFS